MQYTYCVSPPENANWAPAEMSCPESPEKVDIDSKITMQSHK